MFLINQVKNTFFKLLGFFQYHYARMRNYYPCKLIGEKRSKETNNTIVVFHKIGKKQPIEIHIKDLLANPALVAQFHPTEAIKLGSIALEEFIFELPKHKRKIIFNKVKRIMLNSTHDVSPNKNIENILTKTDPCNINNDDNSNIDMPSSIIKNTYTCKLVGAKQGHENSETIIIYTILGKREGYEKTLRELIINKELIEKFHPTEAIKFGFISLGDILFGFSEDERNEKCNAIHKHSISS